MYKVYPEAFVVVQRSGYAAYWDYALGCDHSTYMSVHLSCCPEWLGNIFDFVSKTDRDFPIQATLLL